MFLRSPSKLQTAVAAVLSEFAACPDITLVRGKERFVAHPSPGGWRDYLLCFYVNSDPTKHIGEVQVGEVSRQQILLFGCKILNSHLEEARSVFFGFVCISLCTIGNEWNRPTSVNYLTLAMVILRIYHCCCWRQIVHQNLVLAREGLPGHAMYHTVRNAVELQDMLMASKQQWG